MTPRCGAARFRAVFPRRRASGALSLGTLMARDAGKQDSQSLEEFSKRLDAARVAQTEEDPQTSRGAALGKGFRVASELLAAMIVGPGLGLGVDYFAGTSPWGLLAGIGLGFGAGILNVMRALRRQDPGSASASEDDEANDKRANDDRRANDKGANDKIPGSAGSVEDGTKD